MRGEKHGGASTIFPIFERYYSENNSRTFTSAQGIVTIVRVKSGLPIRFWIEITVDSVLNPRFNDDSLYHHHHQCFRGENLSRKFVEMDSKWKM